MRRLHPDFLKLADMILDRSFRQDALTNKIENTIIDTVLTPDTGRWETGIKRGSKNWEIVQQYINKASAIKGHRKWVLHESSLHSTSELPAKKKGKPSFKWVP